MHSIIILAALFFFAWKGRSDHEAAERRLFCDLLVASAAAKEERQRTEEEKQLKVQELNRGQDTCEKLSFGVFHFFFTFWRTLRSGVFDRK